ncbi:hypothetical protein CERZMDRAFT_86921 [Cercospora zeae-maydis SCOH1-5]|uniref:Uncharacterized protein n=1 Tax=Cercospora zeae-maydis SCOH1-5 TaxID=717836 RepID=A0A6A6F814_9PEZI|nr:hypothetical protein CERZMDRAFT_86921 [Cercospora zeae-maydis SCOH1-5]
MVITVCESCGKDFGSGAGRASHIRARNANGVCGDSRQWKARPSSAIGSTSGAVQPPPTPARLDSVTRTPAEWSVGATLKHRAVGGLVPDRSSEDRSPDLIRQNRKTTRVDGLQAEKQTKEEQQRLLQRQQQNRFFEVDFAALPRATHSEQRLPVTEKDVSDVPPGEEGVWLIDEATRKRKLSPTTGRPILDKKGREFFIYDAKLDKPWKLDVPAGEEGMWLLDPATGKRKLSTITGLPMLNTKSRDYVIHYAMRYEPWKLDEDGRLL